jgi:hypothetical protein
MGHFDIIQWVDFARNLTAPERRAVLQAHLEVCAECRTTVDLLLRVASTAASEAGTEPPAHVVTRAKSIFPTGSREEGNNLRRLIAKLVFDPFVDPVTAGVRSEYRPVRQLVYRAGDYFVDLRLDAERDSTAVTLVGQIANYSAPGDLLASIPIFLMSGRKVVRETVSNDFGEFSLEYTPKPNLRLCLPLVESGVQLEVPLNQLLPAQ